MIRFIRQTLDAWTFVWLAVLGASSTHWRAANRPLLGVGMALVAWSLSVLLRPDRERDGTHRKTGGR